MAKTETGRGTPLPLKMRPMSLADLEQVLAIERQSFPTPWSENAFRSELLENMYSEYIVAECEGRVVGYIGVWFILDEAHITNVAVSPNYRRQHVGDALLRTVYRRCLRRGVTRVTLEVRKSNYAAQELYKKQGFVSHGVRPGYYTDTREDAIIMWKESLTEADLQPSEEDDV